MRLDWLTAGHLRSRVTLQKSVQTQDGMGGASVTWQDEATFWALVRPVSGSERVQAGTQGPVVTHLIYARKRDDVSADKRLVLNGQVFNVRWVDPDYEANRWITINCESGVAT